MSRGPGRLQRRILEVLAEVPEGGHLRTSSVVYELAEEWGKEWGGGEYWDEYRRTQAFARQVRRALDSLHAAGRVGKELHENPDVYPAHIAWWHLAGTRPHNKYRTVPPPVARRAGK